MKIIFACDVLSVLSGHLKEILFSLAFLLITVSRKKILKIHTGKKFAMDNPVIYVNFLSSFRDSIWASFYFNPKLLFGHENALE